MNFCPECGNTISPDKLLCSNCGFKISYETHRKELVKKNESLSPIAFKNQNQEPIAKSNSNTINYILYPILILNIIVIGWFLFHPQTFIYARDEMFDSSVRNKFKINIVVLLNLIAAILGIIKKCFFLTIISFLLTIVYFVGLYIKPENYVRFDYRFNDESLTYSIGLIVLCVITIVVQNLKLEKR